ncbi:RNI-like protein [Phlegmacium glaucopus]|nr:RNI-like protein [Phlegmacium glaucopus]
MNIPPDIDTDEALFQFDPYDGLASGATSPSMQLKPESESVAQDIAPPMSSHDESSTSGELDLGLEILVQPTIAKGKERTKPMAIRASSIVYDLFDSSSPPSVASISSFRAYTSSSSSTAFSPSSFSFSSPGFDDNRYGQRSPSVESMEQLDTSDIESSSLDSPPSSKGKEREGFPFLPPLTFSLIQLNPDHGVLPTPCQSPYDRVYSPPPRNDSHPALSDSANQFLPSVSLTEPSSSEFKPQDPQEVTMHTVSRSQSFSNLSHQISVPPAASSILDRPLTTGPSRTPSNLSLIFEKRDSDLSTSKSSDKPIEASTPTLTSVINNVESGDCSATSWYTVSRPCGSPIIHTQPSAIPSLPEHLLLKSSTRMLLKGKSRSKSSPYPLSALDLVPITATDIFQPFPIVIQNYFDFWLPRELRLHIFRVLIHVHERDYIRSVNSGRLTAAKASSSRSRWVGRDKGIRELFKLSRVSKSWQELVFDGQLWSDLDLHSFPGLPSALILRLTKSAGTFIQSLNFAGHVQLVPEDMTEITNDLSFISPRVPLSYTQLTSINLQSCTGLTTRNLHNLLVRSRSLQTLSVRGLGAVTNTTCDIISNFCPQIVVLNMSRCNNMDASGIQALAVAATNRREHLLLRELRLSGLKMVTDSMMAALGKATPNLEVLDLSYARQLHNSALEAFVACDGHEDDVELGVETVMVTTRDLGRDSNEAGKLKRRVTRLRHLVLSSCLLLTDMACSNLAFSVPKLEFLELAGMGAGLKDDGLVRLLSNTPYIRRLDLEDAIGITDDVLTTITPYTDATETIFPKNSATEDKQPGHVLQQLIISFAANISDSAFLALIRNCPCLTVLEADSTRMSSTVLKEFVQLSRQRKAIDAKIVAVDCRGIGESLVKELSPMTRPRLGWRTYGARKLCYLDARDGNEEDLKIGQDECDEYRVVLKSFYSWQTVDAVKAAREKRKKSSSRKFGSDSSTGELEASELVRSTTRWWSPSGRRATRTGGSGRASPSPILPDLNNDGCRTM